MGSAPMVGGEASTIYGVNHNWVFTGKCAILANG